MKQLVSTKQKCGFFNGNCVACYASHRHQTRGLLFSDGRSKVKGKVKKNPHPLSRTQTAVSHRRIELSMLFLTSYSCPWLWNSNLQGGVHPSVLSSSLLTSFSSGSRMKPICLNQHLFLSNDCISGLGNFKIMAPTLSWNRTQDFLSMKQLC